MMALSVRAIVDDMREAARAYMLEVEGPAWALIVQEGESADGPVIRFMGSTGWAAVPSVALAGVDVDRLRQIAAADDPADGEAQILSDVATMATTMWVWWMDYQ